MDLDALFARIYQAVDEVAYLTPVSQVDPTQQAAMSAILETFGSTEFDVNVCGDVIAKAYRAGHIDKVMMYSALHVLHAHPEVSNYTEAQRMVGLQEMAALEQRGPRLDYNLASVERHRGVLAFVQGHADVALDYFTRALERERTAENLGNVLCALARLEELVEARVILDSARRALPDGLVHQLNQRIESDPDLAVFRREAQ